MGSTPQLLRYSHAGPLPILEVFELQKSENCWIARKYKSGAGAYNSEFTEPLETEGPTVNGAEVEPLLLLANNLASQPPKYSGGGKDGDWHRLDIQMDSGKAVTVRWWCNFISNKDAPKLGEGIKHLVSLSAGE